MKKGNWSIFCCIFPRTHCPGKFNSKYKIHKKRRSGAGIHSLAYLVRRLTAAAAHLGRRSSRSSDRGEATFSRACVRLESLQSRQRRAVGDQRLRGGRSVRGLVELEKGADAQKVKDCACVRVTRWLDGRERENNRACKNWWLRRLLSKNILETF